MKIFRTFLLHLTVLLISIAVSSCESKKTVADNSEQCSTKNMFIDICNSDGSNSIKYDKLYNYVKNSSRTVNIPDGKPITIVQANGKLFTDDDGKPITFYYVACGCGIVFDEGLTYEEAAAKWSELQKLGKDK